MRSAYLPRDMAAEIALEVRNLTVVDPRGHQVVKDVSMTARAGEVLGIAGVQGNGQTELCEALMGLRPAADGKVTLNDKDLTRAAVAAQLRGQ